MIFMLCWCCKQRRRQEHEATYGTTGGKTNQVGLSKKYKCGPELLLSHTIFYCSPIAELIGVRQNKFSRDPFGLSRTKIRQREVLQPI